MKKIFKIAIISIILLSIYTSVYAAERLVDIPVPPDNHGMADFTEEEAAQQAQEYEENQNTTTANDYIGKSSNNYLKSLQVEGYELDPTFNSFNDTYTIYVKDKENIKNLNIIAEADNENAKIDGTGTVEIAQNQSEINIRVTAENGNLKVYKIKIEDEDNKTKETISQIINNAINRSGNMKIVISLFIIIVIFMVIIIITRNGKKNTKK